MPLQLIDPALIGKEEYIVVSGRNKEMDHEIFFPGTDPRNTPPATFLVAVKTDRRAFNIAVIRRRNHNIFLGDQVFNFQLALSDCDFSAASLAIFVADFKHLLFDDPHEFMDVREQILVIGDFSNQLLIFGFDFIAFETSQPLQTHVQNRLGLLIAKPEILHQTVTGFINSTRSTNQFNNGVYMVERNTQSFQDVSAFFRFAQIIARSARNNFLLMLQIYIQAFAQGQDARLAIYQRQHDHAKGILHGGMLV